MRDFLYGFISISQVAGNYQRITDWRMNKTWDKKENVIEIVIRKQYSSSND
jgi:hypothetical protein